MKKLILIVLSMTICEITFAQKGMKNPAAAYSQFMGYAYSVQNDANGNEVGMCTLPDGRHVNAWDFYRGKIAPEYSYAAKKGYTIKCVTESVEGYTTEKAICTRVDKGVTHQLTLEELMEMNGDKLDLVTRGPAKDFWESAKENPNFAYTKAAPTSFDWRSYNGHTYIGSVRDQGDCGSCYAFGASACAEGTYNFATGKYDANTADFSEAYIAWCLGSMSGYYDNFYGCDGADYTYTELQALCDIGTINESYFPYNDAEGQSCPSAATNAPKTKFANWYRVTCSDIEAIKTAIMTYGVVDAAVYATTSFQNYSGGIFTDSYTSCSSSPCYNTPTNHAIALVGWGTNATTGDYWILRNSWGSSWGEGGYMRIDATSARVACEVCYLVSSSDIQAPTAPSGLTTSNVTSSSVKLNWTASTDNVGVTGYNIYRNGTLTGSSTTTNFNATGLSASTTYSFYVTAFDVAGNVSVASNTINVTTSPAPTTYCPSKGKNVTNEWIDLVKLESINNITAANAGYGDFTSLSATLYHGASYTINFSAGFKNSSIREFWNIWIDFDKDATFESHELICSISTTSSAALSKTFTVPSTANTGATRMRVTMKYNSAPTACETFSYGEVEDYTIVILSDTQVPTTPTKLASSEINKTTATLSWTASTDNVGVAGYNIYKNGTLWLTIPSSSYTVSGLTPFTTYSFYVKAFDAAGNVSSASNTINVTTLPESIDYCASRGNVPFEWIDLVRINNLNNITGANGGYCNFTNQVTNLSPETTYVLFFSAGFSENARNEYWSIWIDYNHNGIFENYEVIHSGSSNSSGTLSKMFSLPSSATIGLTRMRVSMKYNSPPTACETFNYGEVEDYSINIIAKASSPRNQIQDMGEKDNEPPRFLNVSPNPANSAITVKINNQTEFQENVIRIYSSEGTLIRITNMSKPIDVSDFAPGIYIITMEDTEKPLTTRFIKE